MGDFIYVLNKVMKRDYYFVFIFEEIVDDIVVYERMLKNMICICIKF